MRSRRHADQKPKKKKKRKEGWGGLWSGWKGEKGGVGISNNEVLLTELAAKRNGSERAREFLLGW